MSSQALPVCCKSLIGLTFTLTSCSLGGLGYAFVTYFASLPDTTVIGIARNTKATESRLKKDNVKNVTLLSADITDYKALQKAAEETSKITGGSIDLLINNAAIVSDVSRWRTLVDFEPQVLEEDLTSSFQINVVGVAHTINAFLPLIRKGGWKKVITISTGMADPDLINNFGISIASPYSISKAAVNTLIAKYNATFGKTEGILFMAISPGLVDTNEGKPPTDEDIKGG